VSSAIEDDVRATVGEAYMLYETGRLDQLIDQLLTEETVFNHPGNADGFEKGFAGRFKGKAEVRRQHLKKIKGLHLIPGPFMRQSGEGVDKACQKLAVCSGICNELRSCYLMQECHPHHHHIITCTIPSSCHNVHTQH